METKRIIILRVPYFPQKKSHYTCGPVCIRMVLSFLEKKKLSEKKYTEILELTMNSNPKYIFGTAKKTMRLATKRLGYKYKNIYGEKGLFGSLSRKNPIIVKCWMNDEYDDRYEHYIVITGVDDKYFYINDPYAGKPGRVLKTTFLARAQKLNWGIKKWGMEVYKE